MLRSALPPGPQGLPFIGSLLELSDPLPFFQHMALDYGPVSHARLGPVSLFLVNEPSLVEELLIEQQTHCIKDVATRSVKSLLGGGLLTSEGETWRHRRKLAAPLFQPRKLANYQEIMVGCATRFVDGLQEDERRELHTDVMSLSIEVVCRTLLGVSPNDHGLGIARNFETTLRYIVERAYTWKRFLPAIVPTPGTLRYLRAKRALLATIDEVVASSLRAQGSDASLIARLAHAEDEQGRRLDAQQLRDDAMTILVAGYETTALALVWTLYVLASEPRVRTRLERELDSELGMRPVTAAALSRLPYLEAVVRETLRLFPPVYAFGREVAAPFELGGYRLPVGSQVLVSPYGLHRNPSYFPDPYAIRPERWLAGAEPIPRGAWVPFGGGPRICIGMHYALMEVRLLLATLIQRVRFELAPDFQLKLDPKVTLRPRDGLSVVVRRRKDRKAVPDAVHAP